jgi:RNA polymerase sigma-70 factor (ECF subfamily)
LNRVRANSRRARREAVAAGEDRVPDVAEQVIAQAARVRVRAILGRLPRRQALVLVLRHSGLSYQDIGASLGMPVGSVGTALRRAESAVRKEFEGDEAPI